VQQLLWENYAVGLMHSQYKNKHGKQQELMQSQAMFATQAMAQHNSIHPTIISGVS